MRPFWPSGAFRPSIPDGSSQLRQLAVRSAGVTLLSGGASLVMQIVSTAVLARLLTPADFGLVTMVSTFSLLFLNFGLNGITEALIQREEIDHTLASNLFWINAGGSSLLALGLAGGGSLLARLYNDPRITSVTQAMALTIFMTGISVIHLALLKRDMRFKAISANDLVARAVGVVVSIVLGWAGWGYWALVVGAVSLQGSTCIGGWVLCWWIPGLPRRAVGTASAVRFAITAYGRFITGYFTNNLDNFLVGWRMGATPLGFYKKAFDLFILPSNQLSVGMTIVAVSALSRLQRDLVQYKRYFLSTLGVMAFVGMGLSGDLTLVGKDLILVLLGPKWGESGRIFTIFGPGIGFMLLYCTHIWIHLSIGRADRWFRWGLVDLVVTTVFLFVGLHWHAEGIAIAWVVSYWIITLPALWYAGRPIELRVSSMSAVIWRYVLASLIAGYATFLATHAIPFINAGLASLWAFGRIVAVSVLFGFLYLGAVIALHGSCAPLKQLTRLFLEMISRGKSAEPAIGLQAVPSSSENPQIALAGPESL